MTKKDWQPRSEMWALQDMEKALGEQDGWNGIQPTLDEHNVSLLRIFKRQVSL
jgi:hypothetical protein